MVMSKAEVATKRPKLGELVPLKQKVSKLSIACGQNKPKGFKGIDLSGDADIKWDLFKFPWPIESGCVREVECSHFVEHIPLANTPDGRDLLCAFVDEMHRVLVAGGRATIITPWYASVRAWQDPTHVRAFNENSWVYYCAWHWYLDWKDYRFEMKHLEFRLSKYGESLELEQDELLRTPRAVDSMYVVLRKIPV